MAVANQTGAIKCKSSINCGISGGGVGDQQQQQQQYQHQHGEGQCGSGCTESIMYTGALDMRPPIVNQPESGENNVFT